MLLIVGDYKFELFLFGDLVVIWSLLLLFVMSWPLLLIVVLIGSCRELIFLVFVDRFVLLVIYC
jgi:ABC-type bacteriocin/lantibiotic exporter with double-glycine peptidase domain